MSGLFNKEDFRDNCGFGLVANINAIQSHKVVINSIDALKSMTHRGGVGSDGKTGDGGGLLLDIDHNYFKNALLKESKVDVGEYFALAQIFYKNKISRILPNIEEILKKEGLELIFSREVPTNKKILGKIALDCAPNIYQLFIQPIEKDVNQETFDTGLITASKLIEEIIVITKYK